MVAGRGLDRAPADAAAAIAEIDRARLTGIASGRLEDALRDVAGIQQFRRSDARSANPTSQGITLRGLGGNAASRALLILDGVPQADPFGGWVPFPAFAPERLGAVRVVRGAGLAPGAVAGTIHLESATPDQLAPVAGQIAVGSRQSIEANAALSARLGGGFATLSADYARGDGFVPVVADQRGAVDRPAPYEQASLAARAVLPIAPSTELQASLVGFTDARERGFAFSESGSDGADASLRLVSRGRWRTAALAYVQVREFRSSFAAIDAGRTAATQVLDQFATPATGLGARIDVEPPLGSALSLRLGGEWRRTTGRTQERFNLQAGRATRIRRAGGATSTTGGFAELAWRGADVTLAASARADRWTIRNGSLVERPRPGGPPLTDIRFPDRAGWEWSGRAGAEWRPAAPLTARAALYRGWRLPTLNELYRPFRAGADATAANALLRPERVHGAEIGVDVRPTDTMTVGATLFANRLDGAIANVTVARGPGIFPGVGFVSAAGSFRRRENLDAVRARGVELEARIVRGPWSLLASYAFVDAEVTGRGLAAPLDGRRPAQTPRHFGSTTLAWASGGWQAAATLRYVGDQAEDDLGERMLGDAVTLDARIALPIAGRLAVEARAENLTGTRIAAAVSADGVVERATPRALWFGLRYGL